MLSFDSITHTYTLNGRPIPSVTQVLEDVGIIDYSRIPGETRERAMLRGSIVHLATQFDDEFVFGISKQPLDEDSIAPEYMGYVEAWRRFRAEKRFYCELIEHRVHDSKRGFAGTLDRTGYFEERPGAKILLDIKTGSAEYWVRMQTAAYAGCFDAPRTFRRMCVELHADGTFYLRSFAEKDWQADFNEFLYALQVMRTKQEKKWAA